MTFKRNLGWFGVGFYLSGLIFAPAIKRAYDQQVKDKADKTIMIQIIREMSEYVCSSTPQEVIDKLNNDIEFLLLTKDI